MSHAGAAIETGKLSVRLGDTQILHGLRLTLPRARWTSIVGPNGAGKSTQLKALAGLLPHRGEVVLPMDEPLANLDPPHQADWRGGSRSPHRVHALQAVGGLCLARGAPTDFLDREW